MKKSNFFDTLYRILFRPHYFFLNNKISLKKACEFFSIFVFLSVMINLLFRLPELISQRISLGQYYFIGYAAAVIVWMIILVMIIVSISFVLYFFYHILIFLFNGKNPYSSTYHLVYTLTPLLLVSLIPYYGIFKLIFYPFLAIAFIDSIYLGYVGLRSLQKLSKENAIAIVIITLIICFFMIKEIIGRVAL